MSSYCNRNGHTYQGTTSDKARRCLDCGKVHIYYMGVWMDEPKEPVQRKPKEVAESQLNLF